MFNMVDIQNATLAGGVAVGSAADMVIHPAFALFIGALAGTISVLGFSKIQGFVENKVGVHDTCGVLNLHGMPGIIGAVVAMIASAVAKGDLYSPSQLLVTFPERDHRTAAYQASLQLAFFAITLGIAIVTGLFSGILMTRLSYPKRFFLDSESWETPSREMPYFFDNRGEAKHSNETPDIPSNAAGGIDDKTIERALKPLSTKIDELERTLREQRRTIRQQTKIIETIQSGRGQSSGKEANISSTSQTSPLLQREDTERGNLMGILESLASKVNFLVENSKKEE